MQSISDEPENSHSDSSSDDSENQAGGESSQTLAEVHQQQGDGHAVPGINVSELAASITQMVTSHFLSVLQTQLAEMEKLRKEVKAVRRKSKQVPVIKLTDPRAQW
jgi:hypothetical protein